MKIWIYEENIFFTNFILSRIMVVETCLYYELDAFQLTKFFELLYIIIYKYHTQI